MLYIDHTTASSLVCSTKAYLRHVLHKVMRDSSSAPMLVGQAIHTALESWMKGGLDQDIWGSLWDSYNEVLSEPPEEERLQWANVSNIMRYWVQTHRLAGMPWEVISTEHRFQLQLSEEVTFWGFIDGLVQYQDGSVYVLEHKTTARIDKLWRRQWNMSAQLMGYVYAAQQLFPELNVRGALVNGIELPLLPPRDGDLTKKCRRADHKGLTYAECQGAHAAHEMLGPFTFSQAQLEQWKWSLEMAAQRLRKLQDTYPMDGLPMEGRFIFDMSTRGNACNNCMYKAFCLSGRPVEMIDSMMVEEKWTFEEARA